MGLLLPFQRRLNPRRIIPSGRLYLNESHPLAQNLVACYVPGAMGGIDLCGNSRLTSLDAGGAFSVQGPEGPGFTTSGGNIGLYGTAAPALTTGNAFSIYYRGFATGITPGGAYLFGTTYDNANNSPYALYGVGPFQGDWTTVQCGVIWNAGGAVGEVDDLGVVAFGDTISFGLTVDGPGNARVSYKGGLVVSSGPLGGTTITATATSSVGFHSLGGQPGRADCSSYVGYIWNRILAASEMRLLHDDPYCFLLPAETTMPALFTSVTGGAVLAATEAADTAAITGANSAVLTATEAPDVAAITGTSTITAVLTATEAADVAHLTGADTAVLAATEAPDVAAITGANSAVLTATEAADSAAITGTSAVGAVLAATEAADTAHLTGADTAVLAATEAADIAAITGANSAVLAATEAPDVAAITGTSTITAVLAATEAPDVAAISGQGVSASGTLAATETADTAAITGANSVVLAATEAPDVAAITGTSTITAVLAAIEVRDSASLTGTGGPVVVVPFVEQPPRLPAPDVHLINRDGTPTAAFHDYLRRQEEFLKRMGKAIT